MNLKKRQRSENELEEDKIAMNVDTAESSTPSMLSRSQMPGPKPIKIKKKRFRSMSKLAACEMECRRRLQKIQTKNLKLEAELLKCKIEYYKKKLAD